MLIQTKYDQNLKNSLRLLIIQILEKDLFISQALNLK